ncbi:MAG: c-type cytochrome [Planctomycetaceae bacterium]|nr:c-type cytochrome [Planctomycetaceae bacterium]
MPGSNRLVLWSVSAGLYLGLGLHCPTASLRAESNTPRVYTQAVEVAPAILRDAPVPVAPVYDFSEGPVPQWIWGVDANRNYRLRTTFELSVSPEAIVEAVVRTTCDNQMKVRLNGRQIAESSEWQTPVTVDVKQFLRAGTNEIEVDAVNHGGIAAYLFKLMMRDRNGKRQFVVSSAEWQIVPGENAAAEQVRVVGKLGDGPWRDVFNNTETGSRVPANTFVLLPGFRVEKLFSVPREELGSWVVIAFDDQGRLLASDQGGLGICRITPPSLDGSGSTRVEKLNLPLTSAQGLLYAFDSLYVCVNGGPGSGLYRARDMTGDDQFDEVTKLKEIRGGGEHGPHALRLSPDGKSIYVICGNHTAPPFPAGADRDHPLYSSRIPTNWQEDLLLPRQWDANGHARGVLAPGGWIAKTDPEGQTWEVFSMGYRNPYSMAFHRAGDLFAYDADMEWDMGAPWYRPTRVVHAVSGSEFGWRSGTGKWPAYYTDSLPELINIGPGSPVGMSFGYGAKFPRKYEEALYICDWTFGTMYAIHLEPEGASYRAHMEEFLSRSPLPLTDCAVGPDGALYFTVGGRGAQSELFRVVHTGEVASTAAVTPDAAEDTGKDATALKRLREEFEQFHGREKSAGAEEIRKLVGALGHGDRHIRYAARIGLEYQAQQSWADYVLESPDPAIVINGVIGLARQDNPEMQPRLITALRRLPYARLTPERQLDLLRAWQLVFVRLGPPEESLAKELADELVVHFPARELAGSKSAMIGDGGYALPMLEALNRELLILLVYLQSDQVAALAMEELRRERRLGETESPQLLARNLGYGRAIAGMLANQPDLQQVHYAFVLRNLKAGWSLQDRKDYFNWFNTAGTWSGGNSYRKFLQNISEEAFENATERERVYVEASGVRQPFRVPELPRPEGPGQSWTMEEVLTLAETSLQQRNYENGKKMYAATRCVVCHRFAGEGGATGPDLTQLAGRFNTRDLIEAIVLPSKVISDQYRATQVITTEGKVLVGRILTETPEQLTLLLDPEDATKVVDLPREEIEEMQPSQTSLMPADLLKPLNREEMLDLLAYLLSRGDAGHALFKK